MNDAGREWPAIGLLTFCQVLALSAWFFFACALAVAAANACMFVVDPAELGAPLLRLVLGACMAGVYPVWATARLRSLPESASLAGGRR